MQKIANPWQKKKNLYYYHFYYYHHYHHLDHPKEKEHCLDYSVAPVPACCSHYLLRSQVFFFVDEKMDLRNSMNFLILATLHPHWNWWSTCHHRFCLWRACVYVCVYVCMYVCKCLCLCLFLCMYELYVLCLYVLSRYVKSIDIRTSGYSSLLQQ